MRGDDAVYPSSTGRGIDLRTHIAIELMKALVIKYGIVVDGKATAPAAVEMADQLIQELTRDR